MPAVATDPSPAVREVVPRVARSMHPSVPSTRRIQLSRRARPGGAILSGSHRTQLLDIVSSGGLRPVAPRLASVRPERPTARPAGALGVPVLQRPSFKRPWWARLLGRLRAALADQRGSQITDNLGLIVIGIVAIVAIGGLISGLDSTVFNWVTKQLGLGG